MPKSRIHRFMTLEELNVNLSVQRIEGLVAAKVEKIARAFNPLSLGSFIVHERDDGTLVLLDGMHRLTAARKAGYTGTVSVVVLQGCTMEEEHLLFVEHNTSTAVSELSRFVHRAEAHEPVAMAITQIVEGHGWKILPGGNDGRINAANALEIVYRNGARTLPDGEHPAVLDKTIRIITGAWDHDGKAVNGIIIKGVGKFVGRFGSQIDTQKIVGDLQKLTPYQLRGKAQTIADTLGGTQDAAIGRVLTGMHNNRKRSNLLPEWVWTR